jgi:lysophospholipase L1-like esterase
MPLGDSITQGSQQYQSYRRSLWLKLTQAGYAVDFVGSERLHFAETPPQADYDFDHEGHWGWRVEQVLAKINQWAQTVQPAIVLVHLGSNDLLSGERPEVTIAELRQLVQSLRQVNPKVTVLLAQIIPIVGNEAQVQALNQQIAHLSQTLTTPESLVLAVDQVSGFDAAIGRDTYDGLHPNQSGEAKMAQQWFLALQKVLPKPKQSSMGL